MTQLRFDLRIYGGEAEKPRVDAAVVGKILEGMSRDVLEVCRNLSHEDQVTPWAAKEKSCRLYIIAPPVKGRSLSIPTAIPESEVEWGAKSLKAYVDGLTEIKSPRAGHSIHLPRGFSKEIIERVVRYFDLLRDDYQGMSIDLYENGAPVPAAVFDAELLTQSRIKLALLEEESESLRIQEPDERLHGHIVQGVMYELSDPNYRDEDAELKVEIDPGDGTHWKCLIPREVAPANLRDLFRQNVLVEGVATMRPRKPEVKVSRIVPLGEQGNRLDAVDELARLAEGLLDGQELQAAVDKMRERD